MSKKIIKCVICGEDIKNKKEKSREHVLPNNMFSELYRKVYNVNFLVLPSHVKCNNSLSKKQENFTFMLTTMANFEKNIYAKDALFKYLGVKNGIAKNDSNIKHLREHVTIDNIKGNIIITISKKMEQDFHTVIKQILKGMYLAIYKEHLDEKYKIITYSMFDIDLSKKYEDFHYKKLVFNENNFIEYLSHDKIFSLYVLELFRLNEYKSEEIFFGFKFYDSSYFVLACRKI